MKKVKNITDYMPKKEYRLYVREDGPGAWGSGTRVQAGSLYRIDMEDPEWTLAEEDTTLFFTFAGSYAEVYIPGKNLLETYTAYTD